MKRKFFLKIPLVALALIALVTTSGHAGLIGLLTSKHVDWAFIESVGGMKVALASDRSLVVSCDVSGTKAITAKPTMINSGIGVRKLKCSRAGSTIRLSVVTSVVEKGMTSECGSVDLSSFSAGAYTVVYLNPDGSSQMVYHGNMGLVQTEVTVWRWGCLKLELGKTPVSPRLVGLTNSQFQGGNRHGQSFYAFRRLPTARNHGLVPGESDATVTFEEPQFALTPGQAAVFYKDGEVLGGGWIKDVL